MNILKVKTEKRRLGDFGEDAAARFLKRSGYKILERNFVTDRGEIDIVCSDRKYLAFVEVKTRTVGKVGPIEPRPASAVTREKQVRIARAAAYYGAAHGNGRQLRLDVVEVYVDDSAGKPKVVDIKHLPAAFDMSDGYGFIGRRADRTH